MAFWNACSKKARQRSSKDDVLAEWSKINPDAATAEKILTSVRAWNQTDDFIRGFAQGAHRFLKSGKWKELPDAEDAPAISLNDNGVGRHTLNGKDIGYSNEELDYLIAHGELPTEPIHTDIIETQGVVR